MKITKKSLYAIMSCAYISKFTTPVSSKEIAQACGTSVEFINLILADLRNNQILQTIRGPGGGYSLKKPIQYITVLDIFSALSEKIGQNELQLDEANNKDLYKIAQNLSKNTINLYNNLTIKQLLEG